MSKSRRDFLTVTSLGILGTAAASRLLAQIPSNLPPGAPPAFGAGPAFGPEVSANTFAEAEKLVQFNLTQPQRAMAAASWRKTLASVYERRTGPRKLALEDTLGPATTWNPLIPGTEATERRDDGFALTTSDGEYRCRVVVIAVGMTEDSARRESA